MKLGIDFGTTRIVVAAVDRGNYPLVSFDGLENSAVDWYPSLVAICPDGFRYGWPAWSVQGEAGWTVVRSLKRLLEQAGPRTQIDLGNIHVPLHDLLNGLTADLYRTLWNGSNLNLGPGDKLEVVLGVPAHANSNQRFLTVEAFRAAGFHVLGVLNEPSAASSEFGDRERSSQGVPETMLVYDLGGGTFDVSILELGDGVCRYWNAEERRARQAAFSSLSHP